MAEIKSRGAGRLVTLLRAKGPLTRTQIAQELSVQPSTVTRTVNELFDLGLLVERPDPDRKGQRGYPSKLVGLRPEGLRAAGVFIDPDRLFTCLVDSQGALLTEDSRPITDRRFETVLGDASAMIRRQMRELGLVPGDFIGCGISYPGQHTAQPGRVMRTAYLGDWPEIDARNDLAPYFGMPVYQLNDAKSACLGEMLFGACKPVQNFCYIWLSYGIGGAAVIGQSLYLGRDQTAAEFGGLFPKSQPRPSGQDLMDTLARAGHPFARLEDIPPAILGGPIVADWARRAVGQLRWLSLIIMRSFAPDAIVIGGRLPEPLLDRIHRDLAATQDLGEDYAQRPPVFLRAAMDSKPQLGAAAVPVYFGTNLVVPEGSM